MKTASYPSSSPKTPKTSVWTSLTERIGLRTSINIAAMLDARVGPDETNRAFTGFAVP